MSGKYNLYSRQSRTQLKFQDLIIEDKRKKRYLVTQLICHNVQCVSSWNRHHCYVIFFQTGKLSLGFFFEGHTARKWLGRALTASLSLMLPPASSQVRLTAHNQGSLRWWGQAPQIPIVIRWKTLSWTAGTWDGKKIVFRLTTTTHGNGSWRNVRRHLATAGRCLGPGKGARLGCFGGSSPWKLTNGESVIRKKGAYIHEENIMIAVSG